MEERYYNQVQAGSVKHQSMTARLRVQYGPGWVLNKMGIKSRPLSAFALRAKWQHEKKSVR